MIIAGNVNSVIAIRSNTYRFQKVVITTSVPICGRTVDEVLEGLVKGFAVDTLALGRPDVVYELLHGRDVLGDGPGKLGPVAIRLLTHRGLRLAVKGDDPDLRPKYTKHLTLKYLVDR